VPLILAAIALAAAADASEGPGELLARARAARDADRLEEAVRGLDALLASAPAHEAAMLERAQLLSWLGRYPEALEGYRAFRVGFPERSLEADLRIAQVQAWAGDVSPALETLRPWVLREERQAVLDDATYRSWRGELGEALERLGRWLEAHPGDRDARLARARVRSWLSRWKEARADYDEVLARAPGDAEAVLGMAQLDLWAGRPGPARARLESLPDAARQLPEARILEARVAQAEGRPADARAQLRPLASGGSARREARRMLEELAESEGTWGTIQYARLETNEGLVQDLPALTLRVPVLQGHADLSAGRSEVSFLGQTRASPVATLAAVHPAGRWGGVDGAVGYRQDYGRRTGWSVRGGATLRALPALALRLDAARELLDATPAAIDLRGWMATLDGSLHWTFGEGRSALGAGAGYARLGAGSERTGAFLSGEHRVPLSRGNLRAGFLARGFGYTETLPLGFFNPERYRYAGLTLGASFRQGRRLEVDADLRGGGQKVNRDAVQLAWGYGVSATWRPESWPLQLFAAWSQSFAGLPVADPGDPRSYRESAVRVGLRVAQPPGGFPF